MTLNLFLQIAEFVAMATLLITLVRVFWGPHTEDRLLGVLGFGTTGTVILVLLSESTGLTGLIDVALALTLLSSVTILAFTQILRRGESE